MRTPTGRGRVGSDTDPVGHGVHRSVVATNAPLFVLGFRYHVERRGPAAVRRTNYALLQQERKLLLRSLQAIRRQPTRPSETRRTRSDDGVLNLVRGRDVAGARKSEESKVLLQESVVSVRLA